MPINHLSTNHHSFSVEIRSLLSLYWIGSCCLYKSSAPADRLRIIQHLQTCSKLYSTCRHAQNYSAPADMLKIIQHLQNCSKLSSICRHAQNYPAPADMLRSIQHLQTCQNWWILSWWSNLGRSKLSLFIITKILSLIRNHAKVDEFWAVRATLVKPNFPFSKSLWSYSYFSGQTPG